MRRTANGTEGARAEGEALRAIHLRILRIRSEKKTIAHLIVHSKDHSKC